MRCHGNGADHCCYFGGQVCPHLEQWTVPGRRWACGLLRDLGSWEAVHADPRYAPVDALWQRWDPGVGHRCGDWPAACPELAEQVAACAADPALVVTALCCWGNVAPEV